MGPIAYDFLNPKFVMPRAYLRKIAVRGDFLVLPHLVGNVIHFTSTAGYVYQLAIAPNVFAWSTAAYTLDNLMDPGGSSIDCILFPCHDIVDVIFGHFINDEPSVVSLHPLALGTSIATVDLPPPPADYWGNNP